MFNDLRTRALLLALVLGTLVALPAIATSASAAKPSKHRGERVVSRAVVIPVRNTDATSAPCVADGRTYELRGRLVGTRDAVRGRAGAQRMNLLVHDFGTGGWFWHLRERPAYDYATRLAERGELSLVLDRLGYDGSPLADGRDTCLGAQADLLHQVVQHVRSGSYSFAGDRGKDPAHAAHVVLHGHGVGAALAQLEAGTFDDVDGLVLMSWPASGAARTAQTAACLGGAGYASYGGTDEQWRSLLFRTAPAALQASATRLRNADPCGDVTSLGTTLLAARLAARRVDVPVLLLSGDGAGPAPSYPADVAVTAHTVAGAGDALPLEASAPATRGLVLDWLRSTS